MIGEVTICDFTDHFSASCDSFLSRATIGILWSRNLRLHGLNCVCIQIHLRIKHLWGSSLEPHTFISVVNMIFPMSILTLFLNYNLFWVTIRHLSQAFLVLCHFYEGIFGASCHFHERIICIPLHFHERIYAVIWHFHERIHAAVCHFHEGISVSAQREEMVGGGISTRKVAGEGEWTRSDDVECRNIGIKKDRIRCFEYDPFMETTGFEPATFALRTQRSPNWAMSPLQLYIIAQKKPKRNWKFQNLHCRFSRFVTVHSCSRRWWDRWNLNFIF